MLFHSKCRGNEVVVPFFSHSGQTFWNSHLLAEKGEKSLSQNWKLYFCSVFTGQVLTYDNIREVIKFCAREKLVLFADEVYQETVFTDEVQFHSCRKVLRDLGPEYNKFQLMSINSVSKGFYGGYVHNVWDNSIKPNNGAVKKKYSFEGLSQQPGRKRAFILTRRKGWSRPFLIKRCPTCAHQSFPPFLAIKRSFYFVDPCCH